MSLLLKSLKRADEENKNSSPDTMNAESAPTQVANVNVPVSEHASVDFDNITEETAPETITDEKIDDHRELVAASRIFRAGGEASDDSTSKKGLYAFLTIVLLLGSGTGVVFSGLIPGVTPSSVMGVFDDDASLPTVATQTNIPELEVVGSGDAALSLPRPVIDVQSEIVVNFAGYQNNENGLLDTPEGRREFAQQIAILTSGEEEIGEEADDFELDLNLDAEIAAAEGDLAEIEDNTTLAIKTASVSRDKKRELLLRTTSDSVLRRGVIINKANAVIVAQADSAQDVIESDAVESNVDSGATESQVTDPEEEAEAVESVASEVQVVPSLSGIDRQRMLGDAVRLYSSGAYADAESVYRSILSKNSTNIDALRGLALVAVATGRYQLAVATYLNILEYYPNDPVAVADLANLHGVSGDNIYAIESALKKVIGKRPELDGRLHFALGNLYASNRRWLDAQKSYFDAFSSEQNNPDYAYNLAVVLDYLNKPVLAVNYYRQALDLSAHMPSGFNADQVRDRIDSILQ